MTLYVNLLAGPGTGKSTTAAGVFFELKTAGINCEYVPEYAKGVVWGRTTETLNDQIYVFGKQQHHLRRLNGQVDVVVTDSPILLSLYYGSHVGGAFDALVLETYDSFDNLNFFLKRVKPFNPAGRLQDEAKARSMDSDLQALLYTHQLPYTAMPADRDAPANILKFINARLEKTT